ncbi:MAG: C40 family peptidase [candidate division SR1 bacterium]|nr:C40 family peptidase [candidate division SR1 bacterium]
MVFTKPGNIIAENNTSLDQREKSEQQSLAETLRTIDLKFSIDFLEKSQNNQKSLINTLKNGLGSEPLLSYKEQQLTQLKREIDFAGIEEGSIARTPERIALLQLFLFLSNAYQPDANGQISRKKIDGKWGKETAEALKKFKSQNPQFAQELITMQEKKNQIEAPYITSVLNTVKGQIGKPYRRGGSTERGGFDCSGLWMYAFKKQGIKFDYRLSAKTFFDSNQKIDKEAVKAGDFMFWKSKPGANKHSDIYHIEMTLGEPYQENGKWYVKTIGSAKGRDAMDADGNKIGKAGVGYRIREITPYRKFGRPSYYHQLAENAKKSENTIAKIDSERNTNETVS